MDRHFLVILLVGITLFSGCTQDPDQSTQQSSTKQSNNSTTTQASEARPKTYIEQGDLPALQARNRIRLLAPKFDGPLSLDYTGPTVHSYQQLAEQFVHQMQLTPEWVLVDDSNSLISSLNKGHGDLIVTNMTVTQTRLDQVAFTKPIHQIQEVIVAPKSIDIQNPAQLAGLTVATPEGSAAEETLKKLSKDDKIEFIFSPLDSKLGKTSLLDGIIRGQYQATVLDHNLAAELLPDFPSLEEKFVISSFRPIAWAVRKDNTQLLDQLNQFLVAHHIESNSAQQAIRDWQAIKQSGQLRMLTLNNPASYFLWRGELMGFDYDLIRKFCEENKLRLSVIVKESIPELMDALESGEGDLIAASLTRSEQRVEKGLAFTRGYLKVTSQLIGLENDLEISKPEDLQGFSVGVNPATVFYQTLTAWKNSRIGFNLIEYPNDSTENLFRKLQNGEFDFMMADSHLIAMEQAHGTPLQAKYSSGQHDQLAWGIRPDQVELKQVLDRYIKKKYRGLFYNVTYNKYFKNRRKIHKYSAQRLKPGDNLSLYDELIKPLALEHNMDWRLLVAQMYQESRFDPEAKSFAGAQGLMQVLPRTAKEMGFTQITQPENGIAAGIAYMDWLRDRFPGDLDLQERLYFTLAAYNAGAGHVRDARRLARELGLNADKWFGHTEKAMLLLAKKQYYKRARFGYVRGHEPVNYVRGIRDRYLAYLAAGY